ncbi:hypothetical protein [Sedimentibacter sp. B4]|uniref:hypothetical protein n=1 Tax=Sedimentibacter sp. B4 TaxID=304766 RepID=UPI0002E6B99D|nr:hypothetical protein [Sedimentibacter sp. B4]
MNRNKKLKIIIIILTLIMAVSMILTIQFDDSSIEYIFRFLWLVLAFIITVLRGVWVIVEDNNKIAGYIYFIMAFAFIGFVLFVYINY